MANAPAPVRIEAVCQRALQTQRESKQEKHIRNAQWSIDISVDFLRCSVSFLLACLALQGKLANGLLLVLAPVHYCVLVLNVFGLLYVLFMSSVRVWCE
jgi:hypothetical protein